MSLRTIIRTTVIKITGDPFTTTSRVPPNSGIWEQTKYPPKPLKNPRAYDDYIFTTTSRTIPNPSLWDPKPLPPRPGRSQRGYNDDKPLLVAAAPFVQIDAPLNRVFPVARTQRPLPQDFIPPTGRFFSDYQQQPPRAVRAQVRAIVQEFIAPPNPVLWSNTVPAPRFSKTQRNYIADSFTPTTVPPVLLNPSLWDHRPLPPKPGRTQRNYDDFVFIPVIAPAPQPECIPFRDSIVPTDTPRLSVMASTILRGVIMPAGLSRSELLSAFALRATAMPASILRPEIVSADCTPLVVAPAPAPGEDCEMCFKGVRTLTVDTQLTSADVGWVFLCVGTHTHTLPTSVATQTFVFKNIDSGVITIAGTIDGNPAGYQLVNPYQFVQVTGDGSAYVITGDN